jgi:hypothetical protein
MQGCSTRISQPAESGRLYSSGAILRPPRADQMCRSVVGEALQGSLERCRARPRRAEALTLSDMRWALHKRLVRGLYDTVLFSHAAIVAR